MSKLLIGLIPSCMLLNFPSIFMGVHPVSMAVLFQLQEGFEKLSKLEGQAYGEVALEAGNILRLAKAAPFQGRLTALREVRLLFHAGMCTQGYRHAVLLSTSYVDFVAFH